MVKNKNSFEKLLSSYDFKISDDQIAKRPAKPRDHAKLLIYNRKTKKISFDRFKNLGKFLPKNSVLVFNNSKVIPARLVLKKPTGGQVKLLYLGCQKNTIECLIDRKVDLGAKLFLTKKIWFKVLGQKGSIYRLAPSFRVNKIFTILDRYGETPIPPYLKSTPLTEKNLKKEYQTIFSKKRGSVAAPTASLHFTNRLLNQLKKQKITVKFITLHVNLGTFSPLTEQNFLNHQLHSENFFIDQKTAAFINRAKKIGRPIIPIGTTSLRALESSISKGRISKLQGETRLFIQEDYHFKIADGLITNFHVPRSSLLMLVSALTGRKKLLELYKKAINKNFKFFSFGDGMLVI